MKKKIVIKARMNCDKCRVKGMTLIASAKGVASVAIDGKDKDHLVVTGEDIDCYEMTKTLRKKLRYAEIVTVEEVKESEKKEAKPAKKESEEKSTTQLVPCGYYPAPHVVVCERSYENPDPCCIL